MLGTIFYYYYNTLIIIVCTIIIIKLYHREDGNTNGFFQSYHHKIFKYHYFNILLINFNQSLNYFLIKIIYIFQCLDNQKSLL